MYYYIGINPENPHEFVVYNSYAKEVDRFSNDLREAHVLIGKDIPATLKGKVFAALADDEPTPNIYFSTCDPRFKPATLFPSAGLVQSGASFISLTKGDEIHTLFYNGSVLIDPWNHASDYDEEEEDDWPDDDYYDDEF